MGKVRIISNSDEPFSDRLEAGQLLGNELKTLRGKRAVVLGIPRGGLIIASALSQALEAELDIVLSHKLGAPSNPELAIGAISEDGKLFLDEKLIERLNVKNTYVEQAKTVQQVEIARRAGQYRAICSKVPLQGRVVVVTDDGLATGATMQASLRAVRQEQPAKLIAAVPVGPEDTVRKLAQDTDEMLCLRSPPLFCAVGEFYMRFEQIEEQEVLEILKEAYARRSAK